MSLGTTLRVGLALLGLTMAGACAQREVDQLDKKPELAQKDGYYVPFEESQARGGVGGYVDVPSNSERSKLDETSNQAGVAVAPVETVAVPEKKATVAILEESPQTIHFDIGDATLKEESMPLLDQIATQLKEAPDVKVKIDGFADKTGTDEFNMQLSEDRANNVCDYLEAQGAPTDKLEVASFGDEQATGEGANPEDRKVVISLG